MAPRLSVLILPLSKLFLAFSSASGIRSTPCEAPFCEEYTDSYK